MWNILFALSCLGLTLYGLIALFKKYVSCGHKQLYALQTFDNGRSSLKYNGFIPILTLDETDDYQNGFVHGYYLAEYIQHLTTNCLRLLRLKFNLNNYRNVCQNMFYKLPQKYKNELTGLVDGYNMWANQTKNSRKELHEFLFLHMLPDFNSNNNFSPFGCTTLVANGKEGLIMGRNMDWCPFGVAGTYSLITHWKKTKTNSLIVPGLIGIVTGWTGHSVLAMNVCPSQHPWTSVDDCALFNNRAILENPSMINEHPNLIPYNLTYCTPTGTQHLCYSQKIPHVRDLKDHNPLIVLNYNYPNCLLSSFNSPGRLQYLYRHPLTTENLVFKSLQVKGLTDSWITIHSCLFNLTHGYVYLSLENGYAGDGEYHKIPLDLI